MKEDTIPETIDQIEDLEIEREIGDKTIKEVLGAGDPHFEERMRITNRILFQEMAPIMGRIEPDVREGPGGLRDLHLAEWLAAVSFPSTSPPCVMTSQSSFAPKPMGLP